MKNKVEDPKTLRQLIEENPDWLDLPIGIYRSDGSLDWVGHSGSVYKVKADPESGEVPGDYDPCLIFSSN